MIQAQAGCAWGENATTVLCWPLILMRVFVNFHWSEKPGWLWVEQNDWPFQTPNAGTSSWHRPILILVGIPDFHRCPVFASFQLYGASKIGLRLDVYFCISFFYPDAHYDSTDVYNG